METKSYKINIIEARHYQLNGKIQTNIYLPGCFQLEHPTMMPFTDLSCFMTFSVQITLSKISSLRLIEDFTLFNIYEHPVILFLVFISIRYYVPTEPTVCASHLDV